LVVAFISPDYFCCCLQLVFPEEFGREFDLPFMFLEHLVSIVIRSLFCWLKDQTFVTELGLLHSKWTGTL